MNIKLDTFATCWIKDPREVCRGQAYSNSSQS